VWKLLVLGLGYFVVMFFGHLPDHLILFPTRAPINAGGAVRRTISFENGDLEIWTAQSQSTRQQGHADVFILRFYGNADRWPAMEAEMWKDRAVEIWNELSRIWRQHRTGAISANRTSSGRGIRRFKT
jgi:hypothetical protein